MPFPLFSRTGDWMRRHPGVAHSVMWMRWPYPGWAEWRKRALRKAVDRILDEGVYSSPSDPPPNKKKYRNPDEVAQMVLDKGSAWNLYLAHIAHAIALEIKKELPWSLTDLSATNLRQLLASQAFFEYRFGQRGYAIERTTHGMALPAPPDVMFDFLRGHGLVKGSRRDTIVALIEWCRDNLTHFSGDWSALNLENHWQYRGMPPVSRILDGTVRLYKFAHYTAGCWGTFGFLRAMLRTVGIPVMPERIDGHGLVRFPTEDRYLSHGDDPYNQLFKTMIVPLSGHELLVTRARWDRWYGRNLSAGARARNVGRQVYELARTHLSWRLLHYYCLDQAAGKSRADGAVRGTFNDYFTLRQLEDVQLWERMDAKLAEIGGCPALPDV